VQTTIAQSTSRLRVSNTILVKECSVLDTMVLAKLASDGEHTESIAERWLF